MFAKETTKKALATLLLLNLLHSCVHNKITKKDEFPPSLELERKTIVSRPMKWNLPQHLPDYFYVPADMLALFKVVSSHVELRRGPGTSYPIYNNLLSYGSQAILLGRSGSWRKIAVIDSQVRGWVHRHQLKEADVANQLIKVPVRFFPVVRTIKKIRKIIDFNRKKTLAVKIPENTPFLRLNMGKKGVLVWLSYTNSVAWLSQNASF